MCKCYRSTGLVYLLVKEFQHENTCSDIPEVSTEESCARLPCQILQVCTVCNKGNIEHKLLLKFKHSDK